MIDGFIQIINNYSLY